MTGVYYTPPSVNPDPPLLSLQVANQTIHTDRPDLPACFQLTVLSWLPCIYLWAVTPLYIFYLKRNNKGYIMMSVLNRFKTVRCRAAPCWRRIALQPNSGDCASLWKSLSRFKTVAKLFSNKKYIYNKTFLWSDHKLIYMIWCCWWISVHPEPSCRSLRTDSCVSKNPLHTLNYV